MFFRFSFAVILVVLLSLLGIAVEKQNLECRREISRQHYRMDVLKDQHARLRLRSQKLAAIDRLVETIEQKGSELKQPEKAPASRPQDDEEPRRAPLLFWHKPLLDPRLNDRD
jgi:hypothetical protein